MFPANHDQGSTLDSKQIEPSSMPHPAPLSNLPQVTSRFVSCDHAIRRFQGRPEWKPWLDWLGHDFLSGWSAGDLEVVGRPAGLHRGGVVAHWSWPRFQSRFGIGIEVPLVHAVVDRLLGYERGPGATHDQITPVEWGIWTYLLQRLRAQTLAGHSNLDQPTRGSPILDRVAPDPFDATGLGEVLTLRWLITLGDSEGSLRVWLPATLLESWTELPRPAAKPLDQLHRWRDWSTTLLARAGRITLTGGLERLRVGGVLPIDSPGIGGTPRSPVSAIELQVAGGGHCWTALADCTPGSAGSRLTLSSRLTMINVPRDPRPMSDSATPAPDQQAPKPPPADLPVTLVIELGRAQIPLSRLADLQPGDVIELGRHAREPVELTSNGRLVARGELVQIDTELGVRVLNVFF